MSRKTALKELNDAGKLPPVRYDSWRDGGSDHDPAWVTEASLSDGTRVRGIGHSKKASEEHAAATLEQQVKDRT